MPDASVTYAAQLNRIGYFLSDEGGATAIEYALIASLLSVAVVGSAFLLGGGLSGLWDYIRVEVMAGLAH